MQIINNVLLCIALVGVYQQVCIASHTLLLSRTQAQKWASSTIKVFCCRDNLLDIMDLVNQRFDQAFIHRTAILQDEALQIIDDVLDCDALQFFKADLNPQILWRRLERCQRRAAIDPHSASIRSKEMIPSLDFRNQSYLYNQEQHKVQDLKKLSELGQCQTIFHEGRYYLDKAYREMVYRAGIRLGHVNPSWIVGCESKNVGGSTGCAGLCVLPQTVSNSKKVVCVALRQDYLNTQKYGVKVFAVFHEVAHVVKRHYRTPYMTCKQRHVQENEADALAIQALNCYKCVEDTIGWFASSTQEHVNFSVLNCMDRREIEKLKRAAAGLSFAHCLRNQTTHPDDLYRILHIYDRAYGPHSSYTEASFCDFHGSLYRNPKNLSTGSI